MIDTNQGKTVNRDPVFTREVVVDTESKLFGLHKPPTKIQLPSFAENDQITPQRATIMTSFQPFESESTLVKRSCNTLSGVTIDRFEHLPTQVQNTSHIIMDEHYRGGFQSRLNAKDCDVKQCSDLIKVKPGYGNRCFDNV